MFFDNEDDVEYVQSVISMYSDRNFIDVDKILESL